MSKPIATLLAAAAFTIGLMSHPGPAGAVPAANAFVGKAPISNLETCALLWRWLAWRWLAWWLARRRLGLLRWRICRRRNPRRDVGGALLLSAAIYYPAPGYYEDAAPDGAVDYCMRRFRSYDPAPAPISATMVTASMSINGYPGSAAIGYAGFPRRVKFMA